MYINLLKLLMIIAISLLISTHVSVPVAVSKSVSDLSFGQSLAIQIEANPVYSLKWIFPTRKENVGEDFNRKTDELFYSCIEAGLTEKQATLVQGLVDHESAGTWNENIIGDNGNSRGIAQWHKPSGRIAPKTFSEQADLICKEMKWKFATYPTNLALTAHNSPRMASWGMIKWSYVNKILKSAKLFK